MSKNEFDPYREALVMEAETCWPEGVEVAPVQRSRVEQALHAAPKDAGQLDYVRMHTGFRRRITVTLADLERIG